MALENLIHSEKNVKGGIVKAEIENIDTLNRGIDVTSESKEERMLLETIWCRSAGAVMYARNSDGSVTLTIGPTKPED